MKYSTLIALSIFLFLMTACSSYKQIPYLQKSEDTDEKFQSQVPNLYKVKIMPDDLLTIVVSSSVPELAAPFNLMVPTPSSASNSSTSSGNLYTYLVDAQGYIHFPILGKMKLGGLTKGEAEYAIKQRLTSYLNEEPIVDIRIVNYKITVTGEVTNPNRFTIPNEKINILEALAMAGDMTIYGRRDNVQIFRKDMHGKDEIIEVNLNDAELLLSPHYYLQQNDILYVTPNKTKAKNAGVSTSTTIWISVTSILVSLTSLLVNILK
ncbi:MAG: polysaccharide biosynthesis/export family protein [Bacteroides sp.]|nr:polysaccharide biosynthesis/export family protein [Bacteroides sp.]